MLENNNNEAKNKALERFIFLEGKGRVGLLCLSILKSNTSLIIFAKPPNINTTLINGNKIKYAASDAASGVLEYIK